jgi:Domain of unknown function (DUF4352)
MQRRLFQWNGIGIVALIIGIIGVIFGAAPSLFWLAGVFGSVGLILGVIGRRQATRGEVSSGLMALWGIVISAVAVALSIVGLVIGLPVFGNADKSGTEASDVGPTGPGPTPKPVPQEVEQEPARIGELAVDGDFTFVVTAVEDSPAIIEDAGIGTEPRGKFVLVTMTVTNNSNSPRSLPGANQYLIDMEGRKASADTATAAHLPDDAQSLYAEIDPGNTATGIVVFDIPVDATPAGLELHQSASSDGVTVALA